MKHTIFHSFLLLSFLHCATAEEGLSFVFTGQREGEPVSKFRVETFSGNDYAAFARFLTSPPPNTMTDSAAPVIVVFQCSQRRALKEWTELFHQAESPTASPFKKLLHSASDGLVAEVSDMKAFNWAVLSEESGFSVRRTGEDVDISNIAEDLDSLGAFTNGRTNVVLAQVECGDVEAEIDRATKTMNELKTHVHDNVVVVMEHALSTPKEAFPRSMSSSNADEGLRIDSVTLESVFIIGLMFAVAYLAVVCLMGIQTPTSWATEQLDVGRDAQSSALVQTLSEK